MIGRDDGIAVPDDPLANEPPNPIDLLFCFALERLRIPAQDNSPALDLGSDELGELQVVAPYAPLGHPPDCMPCQIRSAHGSFPLKCLLGPAFGLPVIMDGSVHPPG
jgi:hypothetical protein